MAIIRIPFNKPYLTGKEHEYLAKATESGHISGDGPFSKKCQEFLEKYLGVPRVLLTTSGTSALEMAALLFRVGPEDEVILPSFTFVSTANAFRLRGGRLVFADIKPDTLSLNEDALSGLVSDRTRVIVPVHYGGVGCNMDAVMDFARKREIRVLEDAAQALGACYRDKPLGTFGDLAALSFHETKNLQCGEGGALIINDQTLAERAEIIREKGTDRAKFFRGETDKYTWIDLGSSLLPSDLLAAFLFAQLENIEELAARRRRIFQIYREALEPLEHQGRLRLPVIPSGYRSNYHIFYLLLNEPEQRDRLMRSLRAKGILAVFHYLPLHLSPVGRSMGWREGDFPVTESVSARLLRLPLYYELTEADQDEIIHTVIDFFN
jgi:dTDP-4-amino-4,6-dideoxygalactose transaminase